MRRPLKENLERVRLLIAGRETTKTDARAADGSPCSWHSPQARKFGIYGAIHRAVEENGDRGDVWKALLDAREDQSLVLTAYEQRYPIVGLIDRALADLP